LRDAQEHVETPRSTFRESKPPKKFPDYMALMSNILDSEPSSFQEAADQQVWWDAMVEEYTSIMKNDVWDIVPRSEGKSIVSSRWLYKIKHVADGSIEKFKARFVARGFSQREGVDYKETFALVARYIEQPQGFEVSGKESHVCFAVNTLSQFMVEPRQEHWVATKHVLRYLRGTMEYGLRYLGGGEVKLQVYLDSDWAGSATERKSTLGCCFSLGSMMVSWFNRKQTSMALSSTESRDHFIQDKIQMGAVKLQYIPTDQQVVDILTKPLARGKFEAFRDRLGLVQNSFLAKREC
jgi:hypothetical protein